MFRFDPEIHKRRSIRLQGYDYSREGLYFITIITKGRQHLFGTIIDGVMKLNEAGRTAEKCWLEIPTHYQRVKLHAYVIMPNHVHGILELTEVPVGLEPEERAWEDACARVGVQYIEPLPQPYPDPAYPPLPKQNQYQRIISGSIGAIVRGFKIGVTNYFRHNSNDEKIWQRNFYEHIIRDEGDYQRISRYINDNPLNWERDELGSG